MNGFMMVATEPMFRALADNTRQRLLRVLSAHELSVSELVEVLGQPQSTVSRHLKVLREADLLLDRRSGTTTLYSARPAFGDHPGAPGPLQTEHADHGGSALQGRMGESNGAGQ